MNHSLDIRVYYEDTDAGGIVYHSNYLNFGERARTELLRCLGFENKSLEETKGILFVVRHIDAHYFKPSYLDDALKVETTVTELKNTSLIMKQSVFRRNEMVFSMDVTLVCVGANDTKPIRFPEELRAGFQKFLDKS